MPPETPEKSEPKRNRRLRGSTPVLGVVVTTHERPTRPGTQNKPAVGIYFTESRASARMRFSVSLGCITSQTFSIGG